MHFILSWDIKIEGPRREEIEVAMLAGIKNFSWVRPLTTFYIVQINSPVDWENIFKYLTAVGQRYPALVHFIMSPPIQGGKYNGLLPPNLWSEINKHST
jgi:hypothetical protein